MLNDKWSPKDYRDHAGYVAKLGLPILDLLAAHPHQNILDLGCGDGELTAKITASGAKVVAIDASPNMVEAARARGLDARVEDGAQLSYNKQFDTVFSNAALHWMQDINPVLNGVRTALKPGGKFVGEFGGHANIAAIRVALLSALAKHAPTMEPKAFPWYFPTENAFRAKLEEHGFEIHYLKTFARPTPLPTDIAGWLRTFASGILSRYPPSVVTDIIHDTEQLLRSVLCDEEGKWTADYVRLRFVAYTIP